MKDLRSRGGIAVRAGSKAEEILLENNAWTLTGTSQVYSCGTFKLAEIAFIKSFNRINGEWRYNGLIRFTARIKPLYRFKAAGTPARQWQSYWPLQWQTP